MPESNQPAARSRMNWTTLLLAGFFLFIFCPLGVIVFVAMFGRVTGEELSPITFEQRSFVYYEIPYVKLQVMPVRRRDTSSSLRDDLVSFGLLPPSKISSRWDLVSTSQTKGYSPDCDAAILANYLLVDGWTRNNWGHWTVDHLDLAKVFWPKVAEMARLRRYLVIPSLFRTAELADDPQQLEKDLIVLCTAEIEEAAAEWTSQGKTDQAVLAYEYLQQLHPENATYQKELDQLASPNMSD